MDEPWDPDWTVGPWEIIAETLAERKCSEVEFALRCETSVEAVQRLLRGDDRVGIKWAKLLNRELGVSEEFWLALQANYDKDIDAGRKVW